MQHTKAYEREKKKQCEYKEKVKIRPELNNKKTKKIESRKKVNKMQIYFLNNEYHMYVAKLMNKGEDLAKWLRCCLGCWHHS